MSALGRGYHSRPMSALGQKRTFLLIGEFKGDTTASSIYVNVERFPAPTRRSPSNVVGLMQDCEPSSTIFGALVSDRVAVSRPSPGFRYVSRYQLDAGINFGTALVLALTAAAGDSRQQQWANH